MSSPFRPRMHSARSQHAAGRTASSTSHTRANTATHVDEGHHGGRQLLALWEVEGKRLLPLRVGAGGRAEGAA